MSGRGAEFQLKNHSLGRSSDNYLELVKTFTLAWPLIIAQLAVIAINTTDVIMMGWLGPSYLAAGTLSTAILHPILLAGIGLLSVITPLVAQNLATDNLTAIRHTTRQGLGWQY